MQKQSQKSSEGAKGAGTSVPVLLPMPFDEAFDYSVPNGLNMQPGDFVAVPLGSTQRIGVVWPEEAATLVAAGCLANSYPGCRATPWRHWGLPCGW